MENNWISVNDRLPERKRNGQYYHSDFVLAATERGILTELARMEGEEWYTSLDPHPEDRITHWMPLPAPPKPNLNTLNTQS